MSVFLQYLVGHTTVDNPVVRGVHVAVLVYIASGRIWDSDPAVLDVRRRSWCARDIDRYIGATIIIWCARPTIGS